MDNRRLYFRLWSAQAHHRHFSHCAQRSSRRSFSNPRQFKDRQTCFPALCNATQASRMSGDLLQSVGTICIDWPLNEVPRRKAIMRNDGYHQV